MKTMVSLGLLSFVAATAHAQTDSDRDKPLGEDTVKVSDHVWQIVGWPNIGIVVGETATLVVDTGLGPRNGATVARVARGDELTFVLPDKTLISGDVVQNKMMPNISGDGGTPSSWIAVLDQVEKLGAEHVLPTHSPAGDGSLVAKEKAFIVDLRTRAVGLKQEGVAAAEAGRLLTDEFKKKYSDWPIKDVTNFVKSIYAE